MKEWLKNFVKGIRLKDVIYFIIILLLFGALTTSMQKCHSNENQYEANIRALTDTISYYKAKDGDIVAVKSAFSARADELKMLNKELYDKIKSLDVKPKTITNTVYMQGETEFLPQDTAWVVKHDTVKYYNTVTHETVTQITPKNTYKDFAFNNEWRDLEGYVKYKNDTLGLDITKDVVRFDYTVAMDKNNKIYIKSSNPYVKYNEISGFQLPQQKQKKWGIGPQVGVSYDPIHNKIVPTIGIGLQWSPIRF